MRTSRSVANLKVPQKQQQQYEGGTPPTVLREATLVYSFLSYEGRPLLKRIENIAGSDPCLHKQSYCGRRLLLLLREATPAARGPDDSADDLNFFLIPVVRPISGLPNGSLDGGCKIPPGPGQNPLKF